MIRFKINEAKGFFFDRARVSDALSRQEHRTSSRFGAFVRTRDKSSQRRRKRVSRPGEPPTARTGLLKKFTFFAYDFTRRSVVVGPALLNHTYSKGDRQPVSGTVPEILEEGGAIYIAEVWSVHRQAWVRDTSFMARRRSHRKRRLRKVHIAARPHTKPAFDKELPKFPLLWRNVLSRAA